ncbi:hypothetical protein WJ33_03475 [Burkholderia ubonensis]|uniref:Uncharacterized protein n=1 Tax=Burkholderia ubonensis TaxID=101571 RepID=A0A103R917_9BURK|nr:hypothetical protein WJ33_03475 [Burkholderia ubonensis]
MRTSLMPVKEGLKVNLSWSQRFGGFREQALPFELALRMRWQVSFGFWSGHATGTDASTSLLHR